GVGLIAISGLWTPKWPLTCAVIAIVWLVRAERKLAGIAAAALVTAAGLAALRLIVPLDVWWFFTVDVNGILTALAKSSRYVMDVYFQGGVPFLFCPPMLRPAIVLPAALLVLASLRLDRSLLRVLPLLLLAAAFLELRFVHPWPAIWEHNYLFWAIAGAWTLALVPSSIGLLLGRTTLRPQFVRACVAAIAGVALLVAFAHVLAVAPTTADDTTYWISQRYLRERLRPGEVVWLEPARHPVSVRDAHYYWFLVGQMVPVADELRKSERGRRYLPPTSDLPACAPPPNLRFTLDPPAGAVPRAAGCMRRLVESGRARRTVFQDVYEIRLESAP
ncbi:MAG TPA: hypothetical protein VHK90_05500, partial [Thermoanaerobaculia bacterium]|nr:hypothetical protein [Thermoanaerobaculia bacterium]